MLSAICCSNGGDDTLSVICCCDIRDDMLSVICCWGTADDTLSVATPLLLHDAISRGPNAVFCTADAATPFSEGGVLALCPLTQFVMSRGPNGDPEADAEVDAGPVGIEAIPDDIDAGPDGIEAGPDGIEAGAGAGTGSGITEGSVGAGVGAGVGIAGGSVGEGLKYEGVGWPAYEEVEPKNPC
jgi:hypothetical protein